MCTLDMSTVEKGGPIYFYQKMIFRYIGSITTWVLDCPALDESVPQFISGSLAG